MAKSSPVARRKTVPAVDAGKVAKLVRLLGSDKGGEVVAAAAALKRTLYLADVDFHDLADAVVAGFEQPKKQQQPARWSPPTPDLGWDASWEALAWWSHYHRHHLSDPDRNYIFDVLMGQSDDFDCGRVTKSMMNRLRDIVRRIETARKRAERW